ncbi:MAG: biopolymer transporter ExbD [Candidatus Dadabacteria bacterium]|nr:MAG: biopolymer transporter ExbD [Candidatus Dadabacteria bacterium]
MAGFNGNNNEEPVANINVTPLVDVMLVLLIIFMITAPMLQQGVQVNLPKASAAPLAGKGEQLVLSIDKKGVIYLGEGNKIPFSQLKFKLQAIMKKRPANQRKLYIKADQELHYGLVIKVIAQAYQAGITSIGLVSMPENEESTAKKVTSKKRRK